MSTPKKTTTKKAVTSVTKKKVTTSAKKRVRPKKPTKVELELTDNLEFITHLKANYSEALKAMRNDLKKEPSWEQKVTLFRFLAATSIVLPHQTIKGSEVPCPKDA